MFLLKRNLEKRLSRVGEILSPRLEVECFLWGSRERIFFVWNISPHTLFITFNYNHDDMVAATKGSVSI